MNVACAECGTRYAIDSAKVKGRRVRIACKHCSAPIIVDGTTVAVSEVAALGEKTEQKSATEQQPPKPTAAPLPQSGETAATEAQGSTGAGVAAGSNRMAPASRAVNGAPRAPGAESPESLVGASVTEKDMGPSPKVPAQPLPLARAATTTVARATTPKTIATHAPSTVATLAPKSATSATTPAKPPPAVVSPKPAFVAKTAQSADTQPSKPPPAVATRTAPIQTSAEVPKTAAAAKLSPALSVSADTAAEVAKEPPKTHRTATTPSEPPQAAQAIARVVTRQVAVAPSTGTAATNRLPSSPVHAPPVVSHEVPSTSIGATPSATEATKPPVVSAAATQAHPKTGVAVPAVRPQTATRPQEAAIARTAGPRPARPPRAMHATIIGVAAPANPPPAATQVIDNAQHLSEPQPEPAPLAPTHGVPHLQQASGSKTRAPKATMIGGLDAPPGSAPSPNAPNEPISSQQEEAKWTVLLANAGAAIMSASDIVTAYTKGTVNHEAKLWREGLTGWKSLWEVPPVAEAFEKAGIVLSREVTQTRISSPPDADFVEEPTLAGHLTGTRPLGTYITKPEAVQLPRVPSSGPPAAPAWDDGDGFLGEDDPTRVAPSPWAAPESAKEAAPVVKLAGYQPPPSNTPTTLGQFVVDANGSRLVNRQAPGNGTNIRGHEAEPPSLPSEASSAVVSKRAPATVIVREDSGAGFDAGFDELQAAAESAGHRGGSKRKKSRKWLLGLVALFLIGATATLSYRTKQPTALYAYLRARHWDVPLDRRVNQFIVQPYRKVANSLGMLFHKRGQ